ncbi:MAG TPA: CaiB/BaiF CoA-transferase family protein [Thermodesulfobacteriota bacterium]|nr:CaiB/BaiF CoA-transferase family protein [Thermodesulfobacteriota bacterium]
MKKHLEGVRVIDLTAYLAGPFLSMHLAALGAEVIKIERPGIGDPTRISAPFAGPRGIGFEGRRPEDISLIHLKRNRGKKSITLDLKSKRGVEIFRRLVAKGDVVVENFAPGTIESFGLDYPVLKGINPRIIFCSIAGYGQSGPYRNRPAFDLTIQATSGMMAVTGYPDGPPLRCGPWVGDQVPALYGLVGILAALASRERTGQGERIDISMQDCCFSLVMDESLDIFVSREVPTRLGNRNARVTPWSVFPTKDGNIALCVFANEHWRVFLEAIEREDCLKDPRFKNPEDRVDHMEEVEALVTEWSQNRSTEEALGALRKRKIPCEPVLEVKDVLEDPQLKARGMIQDLEHPLNPKTGAKTAGFPIRFLARPAQDIAPAPLLGHNNEEVYRGLLGLSTEEMEELRKEKVI